MRALVFRLFDWVAFVFVVTCGCDVGCVFCVVSRMIDEVIVVWLAVGLSFRVVTMLLVPWISAVLLWTSVP